MFLETKEKCRQKRGVKWKDGVLEGWCERSLFTLLPFELVIAFGGKVKMTGVKYCECSRRNDWLLGWIDGV